MITYCSNTFWPYTMGFVQVNIIRAQRIYCYFIHTLNTIYICTCRMSRNLKFGDLVIFSDNTKLKPRQSRKPHFKL